MNLLKPRGIMISVSGVSSTHKKKLFSKTRFSSSDSEGICDILKLLQQEKQAENDSNTIHEEIVDMADNLLKYKWISTKEDYFLLLK